MASTSRSSGSKPKLLLFLAAGIALVVFSGLAFINNVTIVARWWGRFLASNGDASALETTISGAIPWLDWSAVDYSCVSTFIPFTGFLLCTFGLIRILRGKDCSSEFFPFFRTSDQLNISFGLIGTLWGIIVIGYYNMETVRMADLMTCLHTALFSTLIAVVWVFVIDHPILRPLMNSLALDAGLKQDEDKDIGDVLDDLKSGAEELRSAWSAEQSEFDTFSTKIKTAGSDIESLGTLGKKTAEVFSTEMTSSLTSLAARIDSISEQIEKRQASYDEAMSKRIISLDETFEKRIKDYDEVSSRRMIALEEAADKRAASFEATAAKRIDAFESAAAKRLEILESSQAKIADVIAESSAVIVSTKEALQSLMDTLSATTAENTRLRADSEESAREKLRLESDLRSSISKIEENSNRADKAEKMLAKIRAAFGQE